MATVTKATRQGTILGTVQYMSPEQAAGRAVDYRSDQFSFGSILYEMLTGRLAFREETVPQTLSAIIGGEPEPISKLNDDAPDQLLAIVERCLAKEPGKRYDETKEMVAEARERPRHNVAIPPDTQESPVGWRPLRSAPFSFRALGLNVLGLRDWVSSNLTPAPIDSIAVLPLRNLSGDPEQEYFADGMTEALMTDLAKIGALKVISHSSIMRYKGTDKPLREIAGELDVDVIVEGSALRVGDRVRITAQLIDPETNQALWADSYERDLQDVLLLQGEVAQAIASEIQVALTPLETTRLASARPVNPEAHEAYLKGRFHANKLTPPDIEAALSYFKLALEKDPDYALAYVGVARVWGGRNQMGFTHPSEAVPKQREAVERALELDDSLAEAHAALAALKTWGEWDWVAAERAFERALELNPNDAEARVYYSFFLNESRRPDVAMVQIERALELDPFNDFYQALYGVVLMSVRRYDEAIEQFRTALRTAPGNPVALIQLSTTFHLAGMYEDALESHKSYLNTVGDSEGMEALVRGFEESDYAGAMRSLAETMAARSLRTGTNPVDVAVLYVRAGENEPALDWLERAFVERDPNLAAINARPDLDPLRDDPRFQDLVRRMNLPL